MYFKYIKMGSLGKSDYPSNQTIHINNCNNITINGPSCVDAAKPIKKKIRYFGKTASAPLALAHVAPAGTKSVTIVAIGGGGGQSKYGDEGFGGGGAKITAQFLCNPNDSIITCIGGGGFAALHAGTGGLTNYTYAKPDGSGTSITLPVGDGTNGMGFGGNSPNSGGGGAATSVFLVKAGTNIPALLVVASGGGGGGYLNYDGGPKPNGGLGASYDSTIKLVVTQGASAGNAVWLQNSTPFNVGGAGGAGGPPSYPNNYNSANGGQGGAGTQANEYNGGNGGTGGNASITNVSGGSVLFMIGNGGAGGMGSNININDPTQVPGGPGGGGGGGGWGGGGGGGGGYGSTYGSGAGGGGGGCFIATDLLDPASGPTIDWIGTTYDETGAKPLPGQGGGNITGRGSGNAILGTDGIDGDVTVTFNSY